MELALNLRLWFCRTVSQEVDRQVEDMCSLLDFQPQDRIAKFQECAVVLLENLGIERSEGNLGKLIKQQSAVSLNCFTIQDYLCQQ
jgi:hypothetical protein